MDFTSRYPIEKLTVLAQDPSVQRNGMALTITVPVPAASLAPGPKSHRIQVVDFDSTENRYYAPYPRKAGKKDRFAHVTSVDRLVNDRDFHAQNTYGHVATTLAQFEAALGRHVTWAFPSGTHQIKVAPHAFLDANAFYSRRDEALCFGYFALGKRAPKRAGDYIYTCLSADIITHETTHAILDGLRSELMRPSTADQPAFHEGFADCVALLSALARAELLELVLPMEKDRQRRKLVLLSDLMPAKLADSVLLGLAEQFGKALAAQDLMNRSATALRRSVELSPARANYETLLDADPHDLGEILVAATMNAFLEIWYARSSKLSVHTRYVDRDRAIEDGTKAAQHILHMLIRAIDYIPPVNMTFPDFLSAILTVDREVMPGTGKFDYRKHLISSFARYRIYPATRSGYWLPPKLPKSRKLSYGSSGHAEMMWDREAIMRFLWENRQALEVSQDAMTTVNFVRPAVRTGPDGFLLRETVVEYFQLFDVTGSDLHALKLRKPRTMGRTDPVRLLGGGTMVFDDYGGLKYHIGSGVLSQKQNAHIESVWQAGPEAVERRRFEQLHRNRMLGTPMQGGQGW